MRAAIVEKLHDLGRSVIGAMMLGMPLLYTMETWWLGWTLPAWHLAVWTVLGLLIISVTVHYVGFREGKKEKDAPWYRQVADFLELLATSFVTGVLVLLLFGILEWGDGLSEMVRLGLVEVVPLGIGAAITNRALAGAQEDGGTPPPFKREMATFALGALFFSFNVAPTEEMELISAHAGPWRMPLIVIVSLVASYFALYVLQFRGSHGRVSATGSAWSQWGETITGYFLAVVISVVLLWGYGHLGDATPYEAAQMTVVLSFIASMGGAAARVAI